MLKRESATSVLYAYTHTHTDRNTHSKSSSARPTEIHYTHSSAVCRFSWNQTVRDSCSESARVPVFLRYILHFCFSFVFFFRKRNKKKKTNQRKFFTHAHLPYFIDLLKGIRTIPKKKRTFCWNRSLNDRRIVCLPYPFLSILFTWNSWNYQKITKSSKYRKSGFLWKKGKLN